LGEAKDDKKGKTKKPKVEKGKVEKREKGRRSVDKEVTEEAEVRSENESDEVEVIKKTKSEPVVIKTSVGAAIPGDS
jgi:hypothetical protein